MMKCDYCKGECTKGQFNGAYTQYQFSAMGLKVCRDCFDSYDKGLTKAKINFQNNWLLERNNEEN